MKDLAGRVVTAISQPGAHLGILTGLDTPFLIHSLEVSKRLKSFSPTHWNKSFGFPGPLCITLPRVTNVQKKRRFLCPFMRQFNCLCILSTFSDRLVGLQTRGKFFFYFSFGGTFGQTLYRVKKFVGDMRHVAFLTGQNESIDRILCVLALFPLH